MKGDFSRSTFDRRRHYSGVLLQQGRVLTDADWNEQEAIERDRAQALARDLIGPCGGPRDGAGFAIRVRGGRLLIGAGHYWVDGILAENEAEVSYDEQPDLPDPPGWRTRSTAGGGGDGQGGLVYLDAWERFISAIEDPSLRDPALGGPDTTGRVKTVWQVRVLALAIGAADASTSRGSRDPTQCGAVASEWADLVADRGARLAARTGSGGYEGLENRLYRVEVHRPGKAGVASFKWSRDNGSVLAAVRAIEGRDIALGHVLSGETVPFRVGRWVELSDDRSDLHGVAGQLVHVDGVDEIGRRITVGAWPTALASSGGVVDAARHPKVRAWDQLEGASTEGVPTADAWIPLEDGIEVRFTGGTYRTGDYWLIPARAAGNGSRGTVEWPRTRAGRPQSQPPQGIVHRVCPLALLVRPSAKASWRVARDCRRLLGPLAEATDGGA